MQIDQQVRPRRRVFFVQLPIDLTMRGHRNRTADWGPSTRAGTPSGTRRTAAPRRPSRRPTRHRRRAPRDARRSPERASRIGGLSDSTRARLTRSTHESPAPPTAQPPQALRQPAASETLATFPLRAHSSKHTAQGVGVLVEFAPPCRRAFFRATMRAQINREARTKSLDWRLRPTPPPPLRPRATRLRRASPRSIRQRMAATGNGGSRKHERDPDRGRGRIPLEHGDLVVQRRSDIGEPGCPGAGQRPSSVPSFSRRTAAIAAAQGK